MKQSYSLKTVTLLTAVVTMAVLSSCKKEETGKVLFTATIEGSAKTTISINDMTETGTMAWEQGDKITVFDGNGVEATLSAITAGTISGFTLDDGQTEPATAPYLAIYNDGGSVTRNTITLSDIQNWSSSSVKAPMYAPYTNSTELEFKNLCGILVLTLDAPASGTTPKKVTDIVITADNPLCGSFLIDADDYSIKPLNYTDNYTVTLDCGNGVSVQGSENFYIYLPPATYNSMTITIHTDDGIVCTKTLRNTFTIERNRYYPFSFMLSPVGAINGMFTVGVNVDNSPKQVWFSKGNLQYQASTNTWRFAENQYDYVGSANSNISSTYSGWIDLFGWGTGNNPTLISTDNADYDTFVDWASNAISNGGNATHQWRTLTISEWYYLLYTRTNASSKLGTGNINGVGGLIILPDNWTLPSGCSFTAGFASGWDWTHNSYTLPQWVQMEDAGAVFLPAAGLRDGMSCGVADYGYYWSSAPDNVYISYGMDFHSFDLDASNPHDPHYGFSVRPVHNN